MDALSGAYCCSRRSGSERRLSCSLIRWTVRSGWSTTRLAIGKSGGKFSDYGTYLDATSGMQNHPGLVFVSGDQVDPGVAEAFLGGPVAVEVGSFGQSLLKDHPSLDPSGTGELVLDLRKSFPSHLTDLMENREPGTGG